MESAQSARGCWAGQLAVQPDHRGCLAQSGASAFGQAGLSRSLDYLTCTLGLQYLIHSIHRLPSVEAFVIITLNLGWRRSVPDS